MKEEGRDKRWLFWVMISLGKDKVKERPIGISNRIIS